MILPNKSLVLVHLVHCTAQNTIFDVCAISSILIDKVDDADLPRLFDIYCLTVFQTKAGLP